jgi:hypothetical protein
MEVGKKANLMSFNRFKATVKKLAELPWPDLRDLYSWPSNSTIQADSPNLLIAKAANERGEVVAYVTAEPILLVDGYVLNPQSTREDDQKAGAAIDSALAQQAGANRLWIVVPDDAPIMKDEKFLRVLERKIDQPVNATPRVGYSNFQSSVGFVN